MMTLTFLEDVQSLADKIEKLRGRNLQVMSLDDDLVDLLSQHFAPDFFLQR
jgi:ribosomal 50S subunit-associated protein YjgA (DUF615 family)